MQKKLKGHSNNMRAFLITIVCIFGWSIIIQYLKYPHWYRPVQMLACDSVSKFCKGSWSMSNNLLEQSAVSKNADHRTLTFCILGGFCFSVDNWSVWLGCNRYVHGRADKALVQHFEPQTENWNVATTNHSICSWQTSRDGFQPPVFVTAAKKLASI